MLFLLSLAVHEDKGTEDTGEVTCFTNSNKGSNSEVQSLSSFQSDSGDDNGKHFPAGCWGQQMRRHHCIVSCPAPGPSRWPLTVLHPLFGVFDRRPNKAQVRAGSIWWGTWMTTSYTHGFSLMRWMMRELLPPHWQFIANRILCTLSGMLEAPHHSVLH